MSDYKLEYESLRKEADTNKNYVFERPILIVTVSLAAINFGNSEYTPYVPAFITLLLCFNLSFTVNRLFSSARIIAYIQLVIERNHKPYIGWENLLSIHREFANKLGKKRLKTMIEDELNKELVPRKAYGFYPTIYYFHIFVLIVTYSSLLVKTERPSFFVILISVIAIIPLAYLLTKFSINSLRRNLLNEKILMEKVLIYSEDKKIVDKLKKKYTK